VARTAFVICQIGLDGSDVRSRADDIFQYVLKPVTTEFELIAMRSDMDPSPGQITVQIIRSLATATVVIADLTGTNPNVYYELGVAQALGIPVIPLVDTPESLAFDLKAERVIEIGDANPLGVRDVEKAKARLAESLRIVLAEGYQPTSLVSEAAQVRSLDALAPGDPVAREIADMRDRLEVVVEQTAHSDAYRLTANYLYDLIRRLATKGLINTRSLVQAGVSLDEAPHEGKIDLRTNLVAIIPAPPPPPPPRPPADDDIPF
jgi:hypothetical protein